MRAILESRWLRWIFKSLCLTAGDNLVTTPLLVGLGSVVTLASVWGILAVWLVGNAPYLSYRLGWEYIHGGAEDL